MSSKTADDNAEQSLLMGSPTAKNVDGERGEFSTSDVTIPTFKVYKERWLVLAVCCFLALSNAMQWITFSSLVDEVQQYYRGEDNKSSTLHVSIVTNQIFQFVAALTGFGGMYITDTKGILIASILGTSLNLVGASLRVIASIPSIQQFLTREILLHTGSFIAASAQAFFLVLPSKIAECWFPCDQRAIANVLSFVANPAGVALGTILPSLIFHSSADYTSTSWMFFKYTLGMEFLALLPFLLVIFVRRSIPKTPPSPSSAAHQINIGFIKSILCCLTNIQFFIQMIIFALAFSLLWSTMIFLEEPLGDLNYDLKGYPTATCAVVGALASLLAGHVADKTRKFKEIIRFCTIGFASSMIALRFYLNFENSGLWDQTAIYVLCGCLGAFSIPQFPIGVELGVETTFPVLEATSSGVLVIFGSLFMFLIPFVQQLAQYIGKEYVYHDKPWKFSMDVTCGLAVVSVILSFFFLKPRYRRMELENMKIAEMSSRRDESFVESARGGIEIEMH